MMVPGGSPAVDLRHHPPRRGLADQERALEVHPQHAVEIGFREVEEIGAVNDAGIVHQNVEVAERAAGLRDHVLGAARVADVGGDEPAVAVPIARGGGFARGFVDVGDDDARAFGDIALGDREPDAARPAGHDRDLVLEPHAALRAAVEITS